MRLEGQKTASFEIVDFLGDAPDVHVLPVGNAGNISAYWKGYLEYAARPAAAAHAADAGLAGRRRRAAGRRAARSPTPRPWPRRSGSATRPRGSSRSRRATSPAARFRAVTDEQILAAQRELAARDGVFVEPASAAGVAGLLPRTSPEPASRYAGKTMVVTVTGHGLKDIDTALSTFTDLVDTVVEADVDAAAAAAGLR